MLFIIILQIKMLGIFKSKHEKIVYKLLEENGFNNNDFRQFKIGDLAR